MDLISLVEAFPPEAVVFGVLLLCGMGLPLPEEAVLLVSGYLVHLGRMSFAGAIGVCAAGILAGDGIVFTAGRLWGEQVLRFRFVRRLVHPRRQQRFRRLFLRYGDGAIFLARFFTGLRVPAYFMAASLGMRPLKWLALDAAGVAVSVPLSIWIVRQFGEEIDRAREGLSTFHFWAGLAVGVVLTFWITRLLIRRRRRAAAQDEWMRSA